MVVERNYLRAGVNAMLHALFSYLVKYGYDTNLVQSFVNRINTLCGETVITEEDIQRAMGYIKDVINERIPENAYYGTDIPRVIKLIWRDKVFYAKSSAIRRLLSEVL